MQRSFGCALIASVAMGLVAAIGVATGPGSGSAALVGMAAATVTATTGSTTAAAAGHRLIAPQLSRLVATASAVPPTVSCTDLLAPVDRLHGLSADCVPPNLEELPARISFLLEDPVLLVRGDAVLSLIAMIDSAAAHELYLVVRSAYRSYEHQAFLFDYWVDLIGYQAAALTSARPGHSEHQLGTAVDIVSPSSGFAFDGFGVTPEGRWLAQNSYLYGFVVSYPAGKETVTGFDYEPWHVRYIGRESANRQRDSKLTLREFLGGQ